MQSILPPIIYQENVLIGVFACSNIPEDVSLVLERTIQEGSKQNPPAGQEEGLMRDPFESGSVSFDFFCMYLLRASRSPLIFVVSNVSVPGQSPPIESR